MFPRESFSTSFSSSSSVNFPGPLVSNVITKFVGANHEHINTVDMTSRAGQHPYVTLKGRGEVWGERQRHAWRLIKRLER